MFFNHFRYRPSTCTKCKEEIYTYTETQDLCIINKHKCPLGLNVSENVTLDQLREKRKSWDGSQSLPSNITGRAKSETPPRQRQTKSSANLQKDSDFGKEIPHSSNDIDSSQSKIETRRDKGGDNDVAITHSHDKTEESSVLDKHTCSEDSSEATCANTDVQNPSSTITEQSSKDEQNEVHSNNRQSSQSQSAFCDKDNAKGSAEIVNEGTTDDQESEQQVKVEHVNYKPCDEQENASKDQNEVDSTVFAGTNINGQESQNVNGNDVQKVNISAVLTVSESETIQYDPSILRNRDHEPSPEKRLGANLSMIVENRVSSEVSVIQLQVKEIILQLN